MDMVFVLLPLSLLLALGGFFAYLWAVRSGQFEDLETPALRMLQDEEAELSSPRPEDDEAEPNGRPRNRSYR
jgi:cbb3-type cytochrome oxidase maturation protein